MVTVNYTGSRFPFLLELSPALADTTRHIDDLTGWKRFGEEGNAGVSV
jgi:hypothetical protein